MQQEDLARVLDIQAQLVVQEKILLHLLKAGDDGYHLLGQVTDEIKEMFESNDKSLLSKDGMAETEKKWALAINSTLKNRALCSVEGLLKDLHVSKGGL